MVIAIDPGPVWSAFVIADSKRIARFGKVANAEMLDLCYWARHQDDIDGCAIEQIVSYGQVVGADTFETCVITGRFMEAFGADRVDRITRKQVVTNICGLSKAGDAEVRACLIDRFGGQMKAIGRKPKNKQEREAGVQPGPLHGIAADVWSALAISQTWYDLNRVKAA